MTCTLQKLIETLGNQTTTYHTDSPATNIAPAPATNIALAQAMPPTNSIEYAQPSVKRASLKIAGDE
jgi:hypothetical protein